MGLRETANGIGIVGIFESVAILAGLRRPEMHSERHAGGRISVAVAETEMRIGALKGVDILCVVSSGTRSRAYQRARRQSQYRLFHDN